VVGSSDRLARADVKAADALLERHLRR